MKFSRVLIAAVALCGALFATQFAAPLPADAAAGTVLCNGWAGCEAAGMTTHGYATANGTEYWKMVAGHNCTNYTAYMLVMAGMSNVRPWTGNGNANAWGGANSQMTDATATVGSIAWWDANQNGAGSVGHVAYVEQVFADHIVISEDNYGGDFHYRVVYRSDKTWPTGFIHLKDATTSASFPAWRGRALTQSAYVDQTKRVPVSLTTMTPGSPACTAGPAPAGPAPARVARRGSAARCTAGADRRAAEPVGRTAAAADRTGSAARRGSGRRAAAGRSCS